MKNKHILSLGAISSLIVLFSILLVQFSKPATSKITELVFNDRVHTSTSEIAKK